MKNKVVEKKLGQMRALGYVDETNPKSKVFIDPRQRPKTYMGTLIHEKLHLLFPEWSETKVLRIEKEIRDFLWENGYRKVSQ
jgi:hypothetical protein